MSGLQLQFPTFQWYPVTVLGAASQAEKCPYSYSDPTKHRWEFLRGDDWILCLDCVAALQPKGSAGTTEYIYHGGECQ